jgi:DNA-binding transcriptional regulator YiaG
MTKKFSVLRDKMSPEARAESDRLTEKALAEMPLSELRNARGLTQEMLAEALNIQQPAIAKMERRIARSPPLCGGDAPRFRIEDPF